MVPVESSIVAQEAMRAAAAGEWPSRVARYVMEDGT
jgi:hypothetical protein